MKKSLLYLVFLTLLSLVVSSSDKDTSEKVVSSSDENTSEEIEEKCRKSSELTQKDLAGILQMYSECLAKKMVKYRKYLVCSYQELALVDVAGNFDNAELMETYKDEVEHADKVIQKCVKEHEAVKKLDDKVLKIHLCIISTTET